MNFGRLFDGWDERLTHGVIVVVAKGVGEIPVVTTVGLASYEKG